VTTPERVALLLDADRLAHERSDANEPLAQPQPEIALELYEAMDECGAWANGET
jgi:hypothetical protein